MVTCDAAAAGTYLGMETTSPSALVIVLTESGWRGICLMSSAEMLPKHFVKCGYRNTQNNACTNMRHGRLPK